MLERVWITTVGHEVHFANIGGSRDLTFRQDEVTESSPWVGSEVYIDKPEICVCGQD